MARPTPTTGPSAASASPAPAGAAPAEPAPAEPAPLALLRRQQGRLLLAAVDARAAAQGLAAGQPLAAARTLVPDLEVRPEEPAADRAALRRLLDWCRRYTPWTALDPESALGAVAGEAAEGETGLGGV